MAEYRISIYGRCVPLPPSSAPSLHPTDPTSSQKHERVGQARQVGHQERALQRQRAVAHPDPAPVRRLQEERRRQRFRGGRAQYVLLSLPCRARRGAHELTPLEPLPPSLPLARSQTSSSLSSRSRPTRHRTRSCTSSCSGSSASTRSTTSPRPSGACTASSPSRATGTRPKIVRPLSLSSLPLSRCLETDVEHHDRAAPYAYWLYFLYANLTSLNNWRHERGFSASQLVFLRSQRSS